jgi:hypothetical protein
MLGLGGGGGDGVGGGGGPRGEPVVGANLGNTGGGEE